MQQQQSHTIAIDNEEDDECLVVGHYTGQEVLARQCRQREQATQQQQHELADLRARLILTLAEIDALKAERTATQRRLEETNVERDTRIEDLTHALAHERAHHEEALVENRRHVAQHARGNHQRELLTRQHDDLQREFDQAQMHIQQNEHMACSVYVAQKNNTD
jgi:hypothetical protein